MCGWKEVVHQDAIWGDILWALTMRLACRSSLESTIDKQMYCSPVRIAEHEGILSARLLVGATFSLSTSSQMLTYTGHACRWIILSLRRLHKEEELAYQHGHIQLIGGQIMFISLTLGEKKSKLLVLMSGL